MNNSQLTLIACIGFSIRLFAEGSDALEVMQKTAQEIWQEAGYRSQVIAEAMKESFIARSVQEDADDKRNFESLPESVQTAVSTGMTAVEVAGKKLDEVVITTKEKINEVVSIASEKITIASQASSQKLDQAVGQFGQQVELLAEKINNMLMFEDFENLIEKSSSADVKKESAQETVQLVEVNSVEKKTNFSIYDYVINKPITTITVTTAVAAIIGVTYYVYTHYTLDQDPNNEKN